MSDSLETSSIFTTSTILGLGATTGKAIKRLGTVAVRGLNVIVMLRRLNEVEAIHGRKLNRPTDSKTLKSVCDSDLLEAYRSEYPLFIRKRAFSLSMRIVGGMHFEDLAAATVDWDVSLAYDLPKEMMSCLSAYKTGLSYVEPSSEKQFYIPFLLYMALAIALSGNSTFSRMVIELHMLEFIVNMYSDILEPKSYYWQEHFSSSATCAVRLARKIGCCEGYVVR
ncbi:hypothetical protein BT96DRAFT_940234 [Gymnopus androsaceus JB14]|uniref:Uncharacterized protein n=1 Tax=Gymnopus androsaceus JB14 TaxID=1447944 RepID=A0A6A4HII5_9AGAR|nr:hypothetical protein BT96DRAFT_940234 [Gymnopus androsaceus JB14]